MSRSSQDILRDARETLQTARMSQNDLVDPSRVRFAIRNVVVFGRAFTNVLQNLRSTEPSFDDWYAPIQVEMRDDELLRFFYKLRTTILKTGVLKTSNVTHVHNFQSSRDMAKMGPAPAGARAFFMGDQAGGSGWEVELPDGTVEKYYVPIPAEIAESWLVFPDAPLVHKGEGAGSNKVSELAAKYLDYLEALLSGAIVKFGGDAT